MGGCLGKKSIDRNCTNDNLYAIKNGKIEFEKTTILRFLKLWDLKAVRFEILFDTLYSG